MVLLHITKIVVDSLRCDIFDQLEILENVNGFIVGLQNTYILIDGV